MKQQIHINDQGELLLIEVTDTPKSPSALAPLVVWEYYDKVSFPSYQAALTSAIEKGIKFRDQEAVIQILLKEKFKGHIERDELKCTLQNLPNSYTAEVVEEIDPYVDPYGSWTRKVAVFIPLKQSGEPGNEAKKGSSKRDTLFMKQIIDHIKELQKEYHAGTPAHTVLRKLEVELPGLFPEFDKFTLLKDTPTIATDNTLPPSSPTATAEEFFNLKSNDQWAKREGLFADSGSLPKIPYVLRPAIYQLMTEFASLKEQEAQATIKELREELARWESGERNTEQ